MKKSGYVHQDQRARFQNTGTLYTSVFLRLFRRTIHNIVCVFQYRYVRPENRYPDMDEFEYVSSRLNGDEEE